MTSHGCTEWKTRSVVSCFIIDCDDGADGRPRVALFQRSSRVSTYQCVCPARGIDLARSLRFYFFFFEYFAMLTP